MPHIQILTLFVEITRPNTASDLEGVREKKCYARVTRTGNYKNWTLYRDGKKYFPRLLFMRMVFKTDESITVKERPSVYF
jgi:hypothetical protein